MKAYSPQKGDFISVTFDPQSGHEQKGRRPALVVSNTLFNEKTGLAIVCPITSTNRNYPFHVAVTNQPQVSGFVMVEQVKSIDYRARQIKKIGTAPEDLLSEVLSLLDACLY
jgi:mRNA interferase MazF